MTIILSVLNRFKKITGRFLGKFAVKWTSKIPPHLTYVATLPCEALMSAKQAINDKLQGSVATYLRCGGVVNNHQTKEGLLMSREWKKLKSVNIWQSRKQEGDCLVHFVRLANTLLKDRESGTWLSYPGDARLSWPSWLVTYRDGIPARRRLPIQVLTGPDVR